MYSVCTAYVFHAYHIFLTLQNRTVVHMYYFSVTLNFYCPILYLIKNKITYGPIIFDDIDVLAVFFKHS